METSERVIHVDLEVYKQDECPEYETVSYAWGGENGDNSLSQPVFVGPYWDVLLQTRNCATLLRYLRPGRGLRMVWVDAICINQRDVAERESQVAKMGDIYWQCSRVVTWLGADIVTATAKRFRRRVPLHEIQEHIPEKGYLGQLLQRRYFSRMWIIQELVLAPCSVIPLLDIDFAAGAWTSDSLADALGTEAWQILRRSWLGQMHSVIEFPGKTLNEVFQYTWNSSMQATDPRDKIFGVLGLHQPQSFSRLVPDYSLPFQSAVIGMAAYMLTVQGSYEMLYNAVGLAAKSPYPSWAPNCNKDWARQDDPDISGPDSRTTITFNYVDSGRYTYNPDLQIDLVMGVRSGVLFPHYHSGNAYLSPGLSDNYRSHFSIGIQRLWQPGCSIQPNTGALSLKLFHLMPFWSPPALVSIPGPYVYDFSSEHCILKVFTSSAGLNTIDPGPKPEDSFVYAPLWSQLQ